MSRTADELISGYLEQLDAELQALPRANRLDVLGEISAHIAALRGELEREDEVEIRALLDRVGEPAEIAAEARERFGVAPRKRGWVEVTALVLLSFGMIIPLLGWLVGVVLLWVSEVWSTRDKLLGTVFAPAAWFVVIWLALQTVGSSTACVRSYDANGRLLSESCSGGSSDFERIFWPTLLIALALASIATMIYLVRRLRRLTRSAVLA